MDELKMSAVRTTEGGQSPLPSNGISITFHWKYRTDTINWHLSQYTRADVTRSII